MSTAVLPDELARLAEQVCATLENQARRHVPGDSAPVIRADAARYKRVTDPANGLAGYEGEWRNQVDQRVGKLVFNSDGSFFAEYDLCLPHPHRPGLFVEAVTAWGRAGRIKTEARLLPYA